MSTASQLRFKPSAAVRAQRVNDEVVLLDLERASYFGLNDVGARIWQLLERGLAPGAIANDLADRYEVDRGRVQRDVDALVGQLLDAGLIVEAGGDD